MHPATSLAVLGLVVALSACAPFEPRRGIEETQALSAARGVAHSNIDAVDCSTPARALGGDALARLDGGQALAVALACNATLAADQARLGIANADAFEARRLVNPALRLGVENAADGGTRLEFGIAANFTRLILRGPRTRLAEGEFLRAQQLLAGRVLELAVEAESARAELVTSRQLAMARAMIAEAADVSAQLAERYRAAGNLPSREVALARARAAEARAELHRADAATAAARARLQRVLGVTRLDAEIVGTAAAAPVDLADDLDVLQARAAEQRLDLAAARGLVDLLADSARSTRRLAWLGKFEVEVEGEREGGTTRLLGPTLTIELPLFHQGQGARARADARVAWSTAERRRLEVEVASEVEEARDRYLASAARVADHRQHIRPARAAVVARMQEEVNWMLRGVFELIEARIDELEAAAATFEALGEHARARAALERALGTRLAAVEGAAIEAAALLGDGTESILAPVTRTRPASPGAAVHPHPHGDRP